MYLSVPEMRPDVVRLVAELERDDLVHRFGVENKSIEGTVGFWIPHAKDVEIKVSRLKLDANPRLPHV